MNQAERLSQVEKLQAAIDLADRRIQSEVRITYLDFSASLSESLQAQVFLKLENLQTTGSFKFRGALNKVLSLDPAEASKGVFVASTGNHGLAVAEALKRSGYPGTIYLPPTASPAKLRALGRYPVQLVLHGEDPIESELEARRLSEELECAYISPYNDFEVVAGQGTCGNEIVQQLPDVDVILVAVGGGGLISGIAAAAKRVNPRIRIVGCLPERSPAMYECVRAGKIIEVPTYTTLSDGTAGGVEPGAITLPLCQELINDFQLVSEEEILAGMRYVLEEHHLIVEGSAGVTIAGVRKLGPELRGQRVVLVMCGGNVSRETMRQVVCSNEIPTPG